jgi:hypothetical protein
MKDAAPAAQLCKCMTLGRLRMSQLPRRTSDSSSHDAHSKVLYERLDEAHPSGRLIWFMTSLAVVPAATAPTVEYVEH